MEERVNKAKAIITEYNQEHLLKFYEDLSEAKKKEILDQILSIDFEQLQGLYQNINKDETHADDKIEPIEYIEKSKMPIEDESKYEKIGSEAIKAQKLAVVTMAGGQGTRLRT